MHTASKSQTDIAGETTEELTYEQFLTSLLTIFSIIGLFLL